ncbi:MAG: hypothetical protein NVS1B6_13560 [Steroidobacteraceae bacterium]
MKVVTRLALFAMALLFSQVSFAAAKCQRVLVDGVQQSTYCYSDNDPNAPNPDPLPSPPPPSPPDSSSASGGGGSPNDPIYVPTGGTGVADGSCSSPDANQNANYAFTRWVKLSGTNPAADNSYYQVPFSDKTYGVYQWTSNVTNLGSTPLVRANTPCK